MGISQTANSSQLVGGSPRSRWHVWSTRHAKSPLRMMAGRHATQARTDRGGFQVFGAKLRPLRAYVAAPFFSWFFRRLPDPVDRPQRNDRARHHLHDIPDAQRTAK